MTEEDSQLPQRIAPGLRQLAKEFWFPFVMAVVWVGANSIGDTRLPAHVLQAINWFVPAFFFVSWLTSQWFRVRKQQKVEGQLDVLHKKMTELLSELEARTKDVVGQLSGGDDFAYVIVMGGAGTDATLLLMHPGK